jgi:ABC-type lipoprotein release transport system permease subunit
MNLVLYIKLAWRNVLRNKRRTLIAGTAVAMGLAALMFIDALHIGMKDNMIDSATASFMGEGQILHGQYRQSLEVEHTVRDLPSVVERLDQERLVSNYTLRTLSLGMLSSPANVGSVQMVGVDPETEPFLSEVDEVMVKGSYFGDDSEFEILIGSKLADLLEVGLGDRVVMTTSQAHTGDLAQEMFRISGIYHFNVQELDQAMAFVRIERAQAMLGLPGEVHQIALKFTDRQIGQIKSHPLWGRLGSDGNEAVGWTVLMPQLQKVFDLSKVARVIMAIIVFGVVSLGIVNTLFMSLYERMFEFGVLRAVGTRPLAMGRLVILEALALGLIAVVLGCILGFGLTYLITVTGIDFGGIEYEGVTFRKTLTPAIHFQQFTLYPAALILFTALISLYPAAYAARLTPAKAMRKSF